MKVAFISQPWNDVVPPVQTGSIAIWTYEIARRLAQSCHVIVYAKRGRSQKKVEYTEGVHYRRVAIALDRWLLRLLGLFSGFRHIKRPFFASRLYYLGYILQVANDLRKQQSDIVHIFNFPQFVSIIRAFNPGSKIVLHMQCEWLTQLDRAMIRHHLSEVHLIVGASDYITEKIRGSLPELAARCHTVYNGVDVDYFARKNSSGKARENGAKRLLFVGRVSPEKGVHVLLEAFQKVMARHPQVQLKIVGPVAVPPKEFIVAVSDEIKVKDLAAFYSGDYLSQLRSQLSASAAGRVSFSGNIPHLQLNEYYSEADVFIFPSVWSEPFGIPLVEAMAAEIPVVATRSGGILEIVEDGKTGLLAEPGDVSTLAGAIIRLLTDENLRISLGKAARRRAVELFSWERVSENLLCHYKNICAA